MLNTSEEARSTTTPCDRELIHIPGSIQPHGVMIVARAQDWNIIGVAGNVRRFLDVDAGGLSLADILGGDCFARIGAVADGGVSNLGRMKGKHGPLEAVALLSGDYIVVELEAAEELSLPDVSYLAALDDAVAAFDRTSSLSDLYDVAARTFRRMTGHSRVMIYQFLEDGAGVVVGESRDEGIPSFLNHHFPASDIPSQARALYVRNKVRVIPDVDYQPEPIRSLAEDDLTGIDLSDSLLRSVSPIHIKYLKNMGVAASASVSIVRDGTLWGLVACHHHHPHAVSLHTRTACQALGAALSRQIRAKEEAELLRERLRLRTHEESVLLAVGDDGGLAGFFGRSGEELAKLLQADGFAAVQGQDLFVQGACPDPDDIRGIATFFRSSAAMQPVVTESLCRLMPGAEAFASTASGLLTVTMPTEIPTILMWFRAEYVQVLEWAGNPHKNTSADPDAVLTPRSSFEAWRETVRNKARPWNHAEVEAASRVSRLMLERRNNQRIRDLNLELNATVAEKENLLKQKDFLLKEVNHRVQNSLQLVAAFLRLQAKSAGNEAVRLQLEEANRRLNAVALVHRRLYRDDTIEVIDLARYLEDLIGEMRTTMDSDWARQIDLDLAPVLISTDRAVNIGLVLTELVINAQKYAYGGSSGPLSVRLEQHRNMLRLMVADRGRGKVSGTGSGFGARMLAAVVGRLGGQMSEEDNQPGLRTVVRAPIEAAR